MDPSSSLVGSSSSSSLPTGPDQTRLRQHQEPQSLPQIQQHHGYPDAGEIYESLYDTRWRMMQKVGQFTKNIELEIEI